MRVRSFSSGQQAGLTLIELLLSLGLVALMCCITYAWIGDPNQHLKQVADELRGAIQFSRLQALDQGEPLRLMPLQDSEDWSSGMMLCTERQPNRVIHQWYWGFNGLLVSWRGFQSTHYLRFTPHLSNSVINGTFTLKHRKQQMTLWVNRMGRVTMDKQSIDSALSEEVR